MSARTKLPIAIPKGCRVVVSQRFGETAYNGWYRDNGIYLDSHNGTDLIIEGSGDDKVLTYGTRLVCPVPFARLERTYWDTPMSSKGNGITFVWPEGVDNFRCILWHCSEVVEKAEYYQGDTMGFIGNSGAVFPKPSPNCPYCGVHLHLGLEKNGQLIDPLSYFGLDWFEAPDTGVQKDLPPLFWVVAWIREKIMLLWKR
jgi:hypothetical protein